MRVHLVVRIQQTQRIYSPQVDQHDSLYRRVISELFHPSLMILAFDLHSRHHMNTQKIWDRTGLKPLKS